MHDVALDARVVARHFHALAALRGHSLHLRPERAVVDVFPARASPVVITHNQKESDLPGGALGQRLLHEVDDALLDLVDSEPLVEVGHVVGLQIPPVVPRAHRELLVILLKDQVLPAAREDTSERYE